MGNTTRGDIFDDHKGQSRSSYVRAVNAVNQLGIEPVNALGPSHRICSFVSRLSAGGIVPVKLLDPSVSTLHGDQSHEPVRVALPFGPPLHESRKRQTDTHDR